MPKLAVLLVAVGAVGYAVGFLLSLYLAVGSIIALGMGCALIGRELWGATV